MRVNFKDVAAGGVFIIIGAYFAIDSMMHLRMGTAVEMGPGYFPRLLGLFLIVLGVAIAATAIGKDNIPIEKFTWRGILLVLAAVLVFGATIRELGMLPSLFISSFFASIASGKMGVRGSIITSAVISVGSVIIFIYLIKLPYPVFGPWLKIFGV